MDASGTAANLAQLFAQVVNYAAAVANAPKNKDNLVQDVKNCELVLHQLKCTTNASTEDITCINALNALEKPGAPLERMRFILGQIKQEIEPKKGLRKAIQRIKWPLRQKELNELLIKIEREKSNLQLIVASHTRQLDTEIRDISNQHKDRLLSLNDLVSDMKNNISHLVQAQNNLPTQGLFLSQQRLVSAMGRLTVTDSDNGYTMDVRNMKNIIYPLMCLMPSLLRILPHMANRGELNLTAADGDWLKDEYQQLLSSAHLAGARDHAEKVGYEQSYASTNQPTAFEMKRKREDCDEARDSVEMTRKRRCH